MSFTPPQFKDIGKSLTDLFKKQFSYEKKWKIVTKAANNVSLESGGNADETSSYVNVKVARSDFGKFEAELGTDGTTKVKAVANQLSDGVVVTAECSGWGADPTGKLSADYAKDFLNATAAVKVAKKGDALNTSVEAAASVGFDGLSVGGSVGYDAAQGEVSDYNTGLQYQQDDFTAAIKTQDQLDTVVASYIHKVDSDTTLGARFTYDLKDSGRKLELGGALTIDSRSAVKAKVDNNGVLDAAFQHKLYNPQLTFTLAAQYNVKKDLTPTTFGVSFEFGDN